MAWGGDPPGSGDLLQKSGDTHQVGVTQVATLTGFNVGSGFTIDGVPQGNPPRVTTRTLTSATTLGSGDHGKTITLDASSSAFTVTLPAHSDGFRVTFVLTDATNDVTIQDAGAVTVQTLNFSGESTTLVSDGSSWRLAGVPDAVGKGAIVESGSNSNGQYVRWENGEQVCWVKSGGGGLDNIDCSDTYGDLYRTNSGIGDDLGIWTFPASFNSEPTLSASSTRFDMLAYGFSNPTTTSAEIGIISDSQLTDKPVSALAWGYWK